ncbi:YfhO family protein, partial [Singulisphaera rosea]
PLPRARLVTRAVVGSDADVELDRIDPAQVAVVPEPLDLGGSEPGEAALTTDRPGQIHVSTQSGSRQLLVVSESFHDGWRLTVDGREAPVIRVYGDFLGALVGPGRHLVTFDFHPASLRNGMVTSALGLILLLISMGVPLRESAPVAEALPI